MKKANFNELPKSAKEFLSYMTTIQGKSKNTVNEYFFDLRTFFRFLKMNRGMVPGDTEFDSIVVSDFDINFVETIELTDLYEFLSFELFSCPHICQNYPFFLKWSQKQSLRRNYT